MWSHGYPPTYCFGSIVCHPAQSCWPSAQSRYVKSIREQCPQESHRMTEVIRLDAVTSVSSVCLSSNNVPRAFSGKWRAGLEGPGGRYVQMTLSPCPNSSAMLCVQLNQQLHSYSWQDSLTSTEDFQLMHGFHCIPQHRGQIPYLGLEDSMCTNCLKNTNRVSVDKLQLHTHVNCCIFFRITVGQNVQMLLRIACFFHYLSYISAPCTQKWCLSPCLILFM